MTDTDNWTWARGVSTTHSPEVEAAWELYCKETEGDMHVADFWEELPERVQNLYLTKVRYQ